MNASEKYQDIINVERWDPVNHPRMSVQNRAAQFAPFAALSGHDEAIQDTARLRTAMPILDPVQMQDLNEKFAQLQLLMPQHPEIEVQYYSPRRGNSDGEILMHRGHVRRIETAESLVIFQDGLQIDIGSILDLTLPAAIS